jgi:hypothetical protein
MAPPRSIRDPITGDYSIYYRGTIGPVLDTIIARDLEPAAVWTLGQIVERITATSGS